MSINQYPYIICISGKIASGKTYIARQLAERNEWGQCSTSDYLRGLLYKEGISNPTREMLQIQGENEINRGWEAFVKSFIRFATSSTSEPFLIVDGVRHIEFFKEIEMLVSSNKCMLIYLECSNEILQQRLKERGDAVINYNCLAEGSQQELYNIADYISTDDIVSLENYIKIHFKIAKT